MDDEDSWLLELLFDEPDELWEAAAAFSMVLVLGVLMAEEDRIEKRRRHRFYMTRPTLLPNPRFGTAWTHLYQSQNDRAFITTMGFDVKTFHYILDSGFAELWNTTPIPREDVSQAGHPRLASRSLDAAGGLGLVLHYVSSAMVDTSLQEIFAIIPSTTSRYLDFVQDILLQVLSILPEGDVQWWENQQELEEDRNLVSARHPELDGAAGSADGLGLLVGSSSDPELENATFNG